MTLKISHIFFTEYPFKIAFLINSRLDMVEFFIYKTQLREDLRQLLKSSYDMGRAVSRLSIGRGGPRDMLNIKNTLGTVPYIRNQILFNCEGSTSIDNNIPEYLQNTVKALQALYFPKTEAATFRSRPCFGKSDVFAQVFQG